MDKNPEKDKSHPPSDVDMSDGEIRDEPSPSDSIRHVGSLASARLTHSMTRLCDPPPDFEVVGGSVRTRNQKRPSPPAFELITRPSCPPRSSYYRDYPPPTNSRNHSRRNIISTDSYTPDSPSRHNIPGPDGILEFRGNEDSVTFNSMDQNYPRRDMDRFHPGSSSRLPRRRRGYDPVNGPPGPPFSVGMTGGTVDTYIPGSDRHERDRDRTREYYPPPSSASRDHRDRSSRNGSARDSYQPNNNGLSRYIDYRDSPVDSYIPGRPRRPSLSPSPWRVDETHYSSPAPSLPPSNYNGDFSNAPMGSMPIKSARSRSPPPPRRRGSMADEYVPGDSGVGLPPRPSRPSVGPIMDSYIPNHPPPPTTTTSRSIEDRYLPHYEYPRHTTATSNTAYDISDRYIPGSSKLIPLSGPSSQRNHHDNRYTPGGDPPLDDRYVPDYAPRGNRSSFPPTSGAQRRQLDRSWSRSTSRSRSRTSSPCSWSRSRSVSITSSPYSRSTSPRTITNTAPPISPPTTSHYPPSSSVADTHIYPKSDAFINTNGNTYDSSFNGRYRRRRGIRKYYETNSVGFDGSHEEVPVSSLNNHNRHNNEVDERTTPVLSVRTPSLALPARPGVGPMGDVTTGVDDHLVGNRYRDHYRPNTRGLINTRSDSRSPSRSSPLTTIVSSRAGSHVLNSPAHLIHGDDPNQVRSPRWINTTTNTTNTVATTMTNHNNLIIMDIHGSNNINNASSGGGGGWDDPMELELMRIRLEGINSLHTWMHVRDTTNKAVLRVWTLAMEQARVAALVGLYSSMDMVDLQGN